MEQVKGSEKMKEKILKAAREARMHSDYPHELQTDLYGNEICRRYMNNYDHNHHLRMNGKLYVYNFIS